MTYFLKNPNSFNSKENLVIETVKTMSEKTADIESDVEIKKLDAESIKALWSKTYNTKANKPFYLP